MALLLQCCLCLTFLFFFFAKSRWGQWQDLSSITIYTLPVITTWYLPINLLPCRLMCQLQQDGRARFPKADWGSPATNPVGHHLKQKSFSNKLCFCKIFRSFGALQLSEERAKHRESITIRKTFFIVYILWTIAEEYSDIYLRLGERKAGGDSLITFHTSVLL